MGVLARFLFLELNLSGLGIPVYSLALTGRFQWIKGVARLRKLVNSLNVDLMHTNLFEADLLGGLAGRLTKRPVISTIANLAFETDYLIDNPHANWFKMQVSRTIRSFIARTCNIALVCVSQTVAQSAAKRLRVPTSKTNVIYRALTDHWHQPEEEDALQRLRVQLGLTDAWPVILNVGRLVSQKGQRYLIEAMPLVAQEFPKARLLLAGDGFLRSNLTQLSSRMGLTELVTFLGPRDDVKRLLHISDVFVFPSLSEGCPNALIEAMALGKPCIASRIGSTEEVIQNQDTGVLVAPRSPQALAESIVKLLSHPKEATCMGQRAREEVLNRFTIGTAVQKLRAVYQKAIQEYAGTESNGQSRPCSQTKVGI